MANEPLVTDSENQSLRKINAEISALNADVADGISLQGFSTVSTVSVDYANHAGGAGASGQLLATQASRKYLILTCTAGTAFIGFGSAAVSSTDYAIKLRDAEVYELSGYAGAVQVKLDPASSIRSTSIS